VASGDDGQHKNRYDCIKAFSETDFTEHLKQIDMPTLVMHGEDDQIVPFVDSGPLSAKLLENVSTRFYPWFPHGMPTTHADQINKDVLLFIKAEAKRSGRVTLHTEEALDAAWTGDPLKPGFSLSGSLFDPLPADLPASVHHGTPRYSIVDGFLPGCSTLSGFTRTTLMRFNAVSPFVRWLVPVNSAKLLGGFRFFTQMLIIFSSALISSSVGLSDIDAGILPL
jgi:hypothetical protein